MEPECTGNGEPRQRARQFKPTMTRNEQPPRPNHRYGSSHLSRAARAAAILTLATIATSLPLAFARASTLSLRDGGGLLLLEIVILLLLSVLPVAWRYGIVGWKAITEPLTVM